MNLFKDILTAGMLLLLHFFLPLIWNVKLLTSFHIIILMSATLLLLLSQPRISLTESKKHKKTDKGTTLLILGMASIGLISSLLEWAILRNPHGLWNPNTMSLWGLVCIVLGLGFRIFAIWSLGTNFSTTVQIKQTQKLVTKGIYSYLRHPSYTGAWLMLLGYALFLTAYLGMVLMGVGLIFAYKKRIETEEQTLLKAFGIRYEEYQSRTFRMLPFLW